MSDDEREEVELDLSSPDVVTKYKIAAEIANSEFSLFLMKYFPFDIFLNSMSNSARGLISQLF